MKDGGPVFPVERVRLCAGLSLRAYFAAAALQGMCATMERELVNEIGAGIIGGRFYVQAAFVLADAMLAEMEKP